MKCVAVDISFRREIFVSTLAWVPSPRRISLSAGRRAPRKHSRMSRRTSGSWYGKEGESSSRIHSLQPAVPVNDSHCCHSKTDLDVAGSWCLEIWTLKLGIQGGHGHIGTKS